MAVANRSICNRNGTLKPIRMELLGAALMYALDPDRGKRRRAGVRDKLVSATDKAADAMSATARDLSNRARGLYASSMSKNEETGDEVLVARVQSKIGRVVSHPSAIEVSADQGRITLKVPDAD